MAEPTLAYKILTQGAVKRLLVALLRLAMAACNAIGESGCFAAAAFFGRVMYIFARRTREATVNSIEAAFPGLPRAEVERMALRSFVHQSKNLFELLRYPSLRAEDLARKVRVEGRENLSRALSHGRGVILLVAHIGNWEMIGAYLGLTGHRVYSFFLDARIDSVGELLNGVRESKGIRLIPRAELKKSVRCLRENSLLGVIADQDGGPNGVYTQFFGRVVSAPRGPASLARNTGAVVLPNFMIRNADDTYTMIFQKPIMLEKTRDKEGDIKRYTDVFLRIYERIIGQFPDQWLWMYDRWKERRHVSQYLKENNINS